MRILWMCNVEIPRILAIQKKKTSVVRGGWLEGISDSLIKDKDITLIYCYPNFSSSSLMCGEDNNFKFYGIPLSHYEAEVNMKLNSTAAKCFENIVRNEEPDIIHFFGTEFIYTNRFIKIATSLGYGDRIVTSIQGLVSIYAMHFFAGLPDSIKNKATLAEIKHRTSLKEQWYSFIRRGEAEKEALLMSRYIIGRTSWDYACSNIISPKSKYFFCNETLREPFYSGMWTLENSKQHQIFISQAVYPIKGLHKVVEAVALLKERYPDIKVVVAGNNIFKIDYVRGNTYGIYVKKLIEKHKLINNFVFVGNQTAEEMKQHMLSSRVFVCPSSIENSPNSLGEAMLLGLPCIASDVGGVQDMLSRNQEGYTYPFNEAYKLAYYIQSIFEDDEIAFKFSKMARKRAIVTHNPDTNNAKLMSIYNEIYSLSM